MCNLGNQNGFYANSSPVVTNCVFENNSAPNGGAIYNYAYYALSKPQLTNCVLKNNTATNNGGGIATIIGPGGDGQFTMTNCVLMANKAAQGGALDFYSSRAGNVGIYLHNCTIMNNSASQGAGFSIQEGAAQSVPRFYLTNCIVFGNGGSNTIYKSLKPDVLASYSLFEPSVTDYTNARGTLTTTTTPFQSPDIPYLNVCSVAINAGDPASTTVATGPYSPTALPATDLNGDLRIVNGRVDMGATEYQGTPPTLVITQQPASGSAVCPGSNVATSVRVDNPVQVSAYQWYKNGTILPNRPHRPLV